MIIVITVIVAPTLSLSLPLVLVFFISFFQSRGYLGTCGTATLGWVQVRTYVRE